MLANCLKCIIKTIRKRIKEQSPKQLPKESNNSTIVVKNDYKERMDQLRPPKLTIRRRRMRIYWYHREETHSSQ